MPAWTKLRRAKRCARIQATISNLSGAVDGIRLASLASRKRGAALAQGAN